ncbi:MAG: hypothetical protein JKY20_11590 [Alphaproteobacteria bacterium]|nr:hypothetical protein [Alphaproteobacteria bacterium]
MMENSDTPAKEFGSRNLDYEKDSMHILPLHIIPLETPGLRQARMMKNVALESAIEVFRGDETGSGQVDPSRLGRMFDWPAGGKHPDAILIAKLSLMQSFDIYTLRMQLRQLGVNIENSEDLKLSSAKTAKLKKHMKLFMQPLMDMISDETGQNSKSIGETTAEIRQSGNQESLGNLKSLSKKLQIILEQLPVFLGSYGDVFLSLAYFKDAFENLVPKVQKFNQHVKSLQNTDGLQNDAYFKEASTATCEELQEVIAIIGKRFAAFDEQTKDMWNDLTASSFQDVKTLIESNHGILGGVLCGLSVKLAAWEDNMEASDNSPRRQADFILSDMKPGVDTIKIIARSAQSHFAI